MAASARIDPVTVHRLLLARLLTLAAAGWSVVDASEPEPMGFDRLLRLMPIDIVPRVRVKGSDEADAADVVVLVNVTLKSDLSETSVYEHATVMEAVTAVLDEAALADSPVTHRLVLERAEYRPDPPGPENKRLLTGIVSVNGVVQRASGTGVVPQA